MVRYKGLAIFAEADHGLTRPKLKPKSATSAIVEIFADSGMAAVPPSPFPSGSVYEWRGKSLLEVEPGELPVFNEQRLAIISAVLEPPQALEIMEGGSTVKGHDCMLALTSSGIGQLTEDLRGRAPRPGSDRL